MSTDEPKTAFWIATPAGTSAIAVTVLEGPDAKDLIERFFRSIRGSGNIQVPVGRFRYGRWHTGPEAPPHAPEDMAMPPGEDLIVCHVGQQRFEIHSHGGSMATARIAYDLQRHGARQITWQDQLLEEQAWFLAWPQIAFLQASTLRTASILAQQRENWIRFAEKARTIPAGSVSIVAELKHMLEWESYGMHLLLPRKIALFGPPNAGKSSLMNRLGGFERSIIHELPGTTRDVVSQVTAIDGWPAEILDTAGIREGKDEIERQGITFAKNAVTSSELRLLILDSANAPDDAGLSALMKLQPDLVVWNKLDLATGHHDRLSNSVAVSALTGDGIPELIDRIGQLLVGDSPETGLPVPLNGFMSEKLREALKLVEIHDWPALQILFYDNDLSEGEPGLPD